MKKIVILWINPIALIISSALSFPTIRNYVLDKYPDFVTPLACFVVVTTTTIYLFGVWLPFLKEIKAAAYEKKWHSVKVFVESFKDQFPEFDYAFNIMVPKKSFFFKIEPHPTNKNKKKLTYFGKIFKVAWHSGELANKKFKMTINQGFAGKALEAGQFSKEVNMGLITPKLLEEHNFHKDQMEHLKDLYFVASYALGNNKIGSPVLGVVNIESRKKESVNIYETEKAKDLVGFARSIKLLATASWPCVE